MPKTDDQTLPLTDASLRKLKASPPASGARVALKHPSVEGLYLRVSMSRGALKGSFSYAYRPAGVGAMKRVTLKGRWPTLTISDAVEAVKGIVGRRTVKGEDPAAAAKAAKAKAKNPGATFDDLADWYLSRYANTPKSAWKKNYINPARKAFGKRIAESITWDDVAEYLDSIVAEGKRPHANRMKSALSTFFTRATEAKKLPINPIAGMKKPGGRELARKRAATAGELKLMWRLLSEAGMSDPLLAASRVALIVCQRPEEITGMRRGELAESDGVLVWTIPAKRRKTGETGEEPVDHIVPLPPYAAGLIQSALAASMMPGAKASPSDPVFASRFADRDELARKSLSDRWKDIQLAIDPEAVPDEDRAAALSLVARRLVPNDGRSTLTTTLGRMRVPREVRRACLGHSQEDTLGENYDAHEFFDEKREAFAAFERWLLAAVTTDPAGDTGKAGNVVRLASHRRG